MHHRFPQFTWIDFQSRDVIVQYLHPVLQLVDPAPRRRHRQRQYDERVREVLFVQGELEQIVVARIAVQNPNAEARDICKLATFKKRRPERRPPTILTVPILVPHVDVGVLEAGTLLRVLDALQLRDQRRLAARIVAQHQHRFVRRQLRVALCLHLAQDGRPGLPR